VCRCLWSTQPITLRGRRMSSSLPVVVVLSWNFESKCIREKAAAIRCSFPIHYINELISHSLLRARFKASVQWLTLPVYHYTHTKMNLTSWPTCVANGVHVSYVTADSTDSSIESCDFWQNNMFNMFRYYNQSLTPVPRNRMIGELITFNYYVYI
jgi:hypothetical protein